VLQWTVDNFNYGIRNSMKLPQIAQFNILVLAHKNANEPAGVLPQCKNCGSSCVKCYGRYNTALTQNSATFLLTSWRFETSTYESMEALGTDTRGLEANARPSLKAVVYRVILKATVHWNQVQHAVWRKELRQIRGSEASKSTH
jgi:hypothetical protein